MGKRATAIAAGVLCIVSIASAQSVTSETFGFVKVDKPAGQLNLVGNGFGDDDTTLTELVPVDQFNGALIFGDADRVIIWDSGSDSYTTYALYDDGSTVEWRNKTAFYGSGVNPVIPAGSSFWVQSLGSTVDTNLVVSGNVVTSQFVTNQVLPGLQMLSYPFSTEIDLNASQLKDNATGALIYGDADHVITWNPVVQGYVTYALYDDGSTREWRNKTSFYNPAGAIDIAFGAGFWFDAKSGFPWIETNQYYNNL